MCFLLILFWGRSMSRVSATHDEEASARAAAATADTGAPTMYYLGAYVLL